MPDGDSDVFPGADEVCNGLDDDCSGTPDDGISLASDAATRFEDRVLTVFDCATDLEWEKKIGTVGTPVFCPDSATCPDPRDVNNRYQWTSSGTDPDGGAFTVFLPGVATALGGPACVSPYDCTSSDGEVVACTTDPPDGCWRLPEIDELKMILTAEFPNCPSSPCIDPVFGPTAPSAYWSATSGGSSPFNAWIASFATGFVNGDFKGSDEHVRAVRSGP